MKSIKELTTIIDGETFRCEIYRTLDGGEQFYVYGQPVDMKVLFHCDTIGDYIVITEDNHGAKMHWHCTEV